MESDQQIPGLDQPKPALVQQTPVLDKQTPILSAFKIVYLSVFLLAVYDLFDIGFVQVTKYEPATLKLSSSNINAWYAVLALYLAAVCAHLIRIYLTLEHMEKQEFQYKDFYQGFGWLKVEYILRTFIVAVVSLKAISPISDAIFVRHHIGSPPPDIDVFASLPLFLLALYVPLFLWSLLALWKGRKSAEDAFILSSTIGLVSTILISLGLSPDKFTNYIIPLSVAIAFFAVYLILEIGRYFYKYWDNYKTMQNWGRIIFH